jgi:hypothetical protein
MNKVKDHAGLLKDPHTNSIVNADKNSYQACIKLRKRMLKDIEDKKNMQTRLDELEAMMKVLMNEASK